MQLKLQTIDNRPETIDDVDAFVRGMAEGCGSTALCRDSDGVAIVDNLGFVTVVDLPNLDYIHRECTKYSKIRLTRILRAV